MNATAEAYEAGTRLPVPVPLGVDESFNGYLYNVAKTYNYPSPWPLLERAGTSIFVRSVHEPLGALAALLKLPVEELERRAYWKRPRKSRQFFGQDVGERHLSLWECRVCPDCLREGRPHSAMFDIALNTACDIHGTTLLSRCPHCRDRLGWGRRRRLEFCPCGFDLTTVIAQAASPAARRIARLLRRAARLEDGDQMRRDLDIGDWPPEMLALNLRELCGLMTFIFSRENPAGPVKAHVRVAFTMDVLDGLPNAVDEFLRGWPDGALAFFKRVRAIRLAASPPSRSPYDRSASVSARELRSFLRSDVPPFLADALDRHLARETFSTKYEKRIGEASPFMSIRAAARRLHECDSRVLTMCRAGIIQSVQHGRFTLVLRESLLAYEQFRRRVVPVREVPRRYGLSLKNLYSLLGAGFLKLLPRGTGQRAAGDYVDSSDVELLLAALIERAQEIPPDTRLGSQGEFIGLAKLAPGRIEAVLRGAAPAFRPQGRAIKGFDQLIIRNIDHRRIALLSGHRGIARATAAALFGFPRTGIGDMLAKRSQSGLLKLDDLEWLAREYVHVRDIANLNGVKKNLVEQRLRYQRLKSGKPVTVAKGIYRRSEIEALIESRGWLMPPIKQIGPAHENLVSG